MGEMPTGGAARRDARWRNTKRTGTRAQHAVDPPLLAAREANRAQWPVAASGDVMPARPSRTVAGWAGRRAAPDEIDRRASRPPDRAGRGDRYDGWRCGRSAEVS